MYSVSEVKLYNIRAIEQVVTILFRCGKDMAEKRELHHWDNSYLKTLAIVLLCYLKNSIYLVYANQNAVATFQTRKEKECLLFQKLATDPSATGKGVGTFCIETIENMAREKQCEKVCLEVYEKSQHAINFYKKRNYVVCGTKGTLKYSEFQMEKIL